MIGATALVARTPRRRFLGWLGASGLMAAAGVFGTPISASACFYGPCCNLNVCPPNVNITTCMNSYQSYTWVCGHCSTGTCYCCECGQGCSGSAMSCSNPGC
jgi:hypothetical protein